jgi:hypothetical protein
MNATFNTCGNLINIASDPTHAMNPINRLRYENEDLAVSAVFSLQASRRGAGDQDIGDAQFPGRSPEKLAIGQGFKLFPSLCLPPQDLGSGRWVAGQYPGGDRCGGTNWPLVGLAIFPARPWLLPWG